MADSPSPAQVTEPAVLTLGKTTAEPDVPTAVKPPLAGRGVGRAPGRGPRLFRAQLKDLERLALFDTGLRVAELVSGLFLSGLTVGATAEAAAVSKGPCTLALGTSGQDVFLASGDSTQVNIGEGTFAIDIIS